MQNPSPDELPASESAQEPTLTVIVPVFNEVSTVLKVLRRVLDVPYSKQVIVVDDGSTDGTAEVLKQIAEDPEVQILVHAANRGKGAAIRTALGHARGQLTVVQDADLEVDPEELPRLIQPVLNGDAVIVFGSRYLGGTQGKTPGSLYMWLGVSFLNFVVRLMYGLRLTDEAACYKLFPTEILRMMDLQCKGFEFCPEVIAKASRLNMPIREVPVSYHPRTKGAGKKLRWRDGITALYTLWRHRNWSPHVDTHVLPSPHSKLRYSRCESRLVPVRELPHRDA